MKLKRLTFVILLLALNNILAQNPCLDGWKYRVPITVDNSLNPNSLTGFQIKLIIDTQTLIAQGKLKPDGGDFRFTNAAGVFLPFWIQNSTLNTTQTEVWVKVDNIPLSSSVVIYSFYGNVMVNSVVSGEATFEHYDNFDGVALDFSKWTFCGPSIPIVSSGEVTFTSSSGVSNMTIESTNSFSVPVVTEIKVNSINNGVGLVGLINSSKQGYAMAFENISGINAMRLVNLQNDATLNHCYSITDQSPSTNNHPSGITQGIWSYTWQSATAHNLVWPGDNIQRVDNVFSSTFNDVKKVVIGSLKNTASLSVDWSITRKYSQIEPTSSFGSVTELVDIVIASNSGPNCVGDTIQLFASSFANAIYAWQGPNGFTSNLQNPTINGVTVADSGVYVVAVSAPTNCSIKTASTRVKINSASSIGGVTGATSVCKALNTGSVNLTGVIGSIQFWQSSNSQNGPWNNINNTTLAESYLNLNQSTYYRALVESGACPSDTSEVIVVLVDEKTIGGSIVGEQEACSGFNTGGLELLGNNGTISKWQSSIDFGATWLDISNSNATINYTNITDTTYYRVTVENGVCPATFSDTAIINVLPLPVVNFSTEFVCFGTYNQFQNLSSITSGSINSYNWDFGNGQSSINPSPNYLYSNSTTYNVKLEATSVKGCVDSIIKAVQVYSLPNVDFTALDVCDTIDVEFVNLSSVSPGYIQETIWRFGDGVDSIINTFGQLSHKYSLSGSYNVTLVSESNNRCKDSVVKEINVLDRVLVSFISDSVCEGEAIHFINTSNAPFHVTDYEWNFGNGILSSQESPVYTYPVPGSYIVQLKATSYNQCIETKQIVANVYPRPNASFQFQDVCQYDSLVFTDGSTILSGSYTSNWNFGDASISALVSPSHFYQVPDSYTVSLNLISDFGCEDDASALVEVNPVPIANFDFINVCNLDVSPITNVSSISSGTLTYLWDFSDGFTTNQLNPLYVFDTSGVFPVELIVESGLGCLDTVVKDVEVFPLPNTNFETLEKCEGFVNNFENLTTIDNGNINGYVWDFGDGTNSIEESPDRMFLSSGYYPVELTATSDRGCEKDTTITIEVSAYPFVNFNFSNECVDASAIFLNLSQVNTGTMTYDWSFGDSSSSTIFSPEHIYDENGFYAVKLIATSNANCVDSIIKYIEIYPIPLVDAGLDTSVSYGFTLQLDAIAPTATDIGWSNFETIEDNTVLNPNVRPLETTVYQIKVVDVNGCKNVDEVEVEVIEDYRIFISNIVTPDGNGKNDTWKIFNADVFDVIHIAVYNKWGIEVFSANDYKEEWNGAYRFDALPDGTYYYTVSFDDSDKVYKGAVTVLR